MKRLVSLFLLVSILVLPAWSDAAEARALLMHTNAQVDSEGIFLNQVVSDASGAALPALRLAAPPAFGQTLSWSRAQLGTILARLAPDLTSTNLGGATSIRISRRARTFSESELADLLTATLQQEHVRDRGDLELHLTRPWTAVSLPDEPLALRILDMPTIGVTPSFIVRFELRAAEESLGTWQAAVQARIWREIYVARTSLRRGDPLDEDELSRERRDVLVLRDVLTELPDDEYEYELGETVSAGMPLTSRSLKLKPLVHRGQSAVALVQEGTLNISMKVEVLEDGAPGQMVRARNAQSKKELRGKVIDEQTILVAL